MNDRAPHARTRSRLMLAIVAAATAALLLAAPASAFAAKAATRIVAAKSVTVNNSTPGSNPWPKALPVKLQKYSSGHWVGYTGTVKLYRWNPQSGTAGAYILVSSKRGSSVSFSLPGRGKYKLSFAGTTTTKPSVTYTAVKEDIGITISTPKAGIESVDSTTSLVIVTYDVSWNTDAFAGPVTMTLSADFEPADLSSVAAVVYQERSIFKPKTVTFTYVVDNDEILDQLWMEGHSFVDDWFRGNYIVTPAKTLHYYNVP